MARFKLITEERDIDAVVTEILRLAIVGVSFSLINLNGDMSVCERECFFMFL